MQRKYFRVDKRDFAASETIGTASEFMELHKPTGQAAEKVLEETRPDDKPKRGACLMLFEDEECARTHWVKMSNANLYAVIVHECRVLHRGDMHLIDQMGPVLAEGGDASCAARRYWRGELTDNPCIEILIDKAKVIELIGDNRQRLEELRRRVISRREGPEPFEEEVEELFASKPSKGS